MLDTTSIYIRNKIDELGLSQGLLVAFSGGRISQARLAQALSGQSPLRNEDGLAFKLLLRELEELAASSPMPINWKNTEDVLDALKERREINKQLTDIIPGTENAA